MLILEAPNAVALWRKLIVRRCARSLAAVARDAPLGSARGAHCRQGPTNRGKALHQQPNFRATFGFSDTRNAVHGSDSVDAVSGHSLSFRASNSFLACAAPNASPTCRPIEKSNSFFEAPQLNEPRQHKTRECACVCVCLFVCVARVRVHLSSSSARRNAADGASSGCTTPFSASAGGTMAKRGSNRSANFSGIRWTRKPSRV